MCQLLGFKNITCITRSGQCVGGQRQTKRLRIAAELMIDKGLADVAVVALRIGGAGLNCQTMDNAIFMGPVAQRSILTQAKGTFKVQVPNNVGRIARPGQVVKNPEWRVIMCLEEAFDKIAITALENRISEEEAILLASAGHDKNSPLVIE